MFCCRVQTMEEYVTRKNSPTNGADLVSYSQDRSLLACPAKTHSKLKLQRDGMGWEDTIPITN